MFTLDEERVRRWFADADDGIGESWWLAESPARGIEQVVADFDEAISSDVEGWGISLYPLIYESDADGLLIVVYRGGRYDNPGLAGHPMDWDDYFRAPRDSMLLQALTVDQILDILRTVVEYANQIIRGEEDETRRTRNG